MRVATGTLITCSVNVRHGSSDWQICTLITWSVNVRQIGRFRQDRVGQWPGVLPIAQVQIAHTAKIRPTCVGNYAIIGNNVNIDWSLSALVACFYEVFA